MRVVIDTNVIVSGFYDPRSIPGRILDAGTTGSLVLCAPDYVKAELRRVLGKVLEFTPPHVDAALRSLRVEWIPEGIFRERLAEAHALLRDPKDAHVLACALAIGCDIVSGDDDLHAVRKRGLKVWRPSELVGPSGKEE